MVLGVHADVEQRVPCRSCGGSWPGQQDQQSQYSCHCSARATAGQGSSTERRGDSRDKVPHSACESVAAHGHCPGPPTVGSGISLGGARGQGSHLGSARGQGSHLGGARGQGSYLGGSWAPGAVGQAQLISKVVAQHNPWPLITGRGNVADWAALRAGRRQCTAPWHPAVSWIDTRAYYGPPPALYAAGIHPPGAWLGPAPAKIHLWLFFLPSRGRWPDPLTPAQGAGPGPPIPQGEELFLEGTGTPVGSQMATG